MSELPAVPESVESSPVDEVEMAAQSSSQSNSKKIFPAVSLLLGGAFLGLVVTAVAGAFGLLPQRQLGQQQELPDTQLGSFAQRFLATSETEARGEGTITFFEDNNKNGKKDAAEQFVSDMRLSVRAIGAEYPSVSLVSDSTGKVEISGLQDQQYEVNISFEPQNLNGNPRYYRRPLYELDFAGTHIVQSSQWFAVSASQLQSIGLVPVRPYIPKRVVALRPAGFGTVVFIDPDLGNQVGFIYLTENQSRYNRVFTDESGLYFVSDTDQLQKFDWFSGELQTIIPKVGLRRSGDFEYWKTSKGGKLVVHAVNSAAGAEVNVTTQSGQCPSGPIVVEGESLNTFTSSNPYHPFQGEIYDENRFAILGNRKSDGEPSLYLVTCNQGSWSATKTGVKAADGVWLDADHYLLNAGTSIASDGPTLVLGNPAVYTFSTKAIANLPVVQGRFFSFNSPMSHALLVSPSGYGLAAVSNLLNGSLNLAQVSASVVATSNSFSETTITPVAGKQEWWALDVKQCKDLDCGILNQMVIENGQIKVTSQKTLRNQPATSIVGVWGE